MTTPFSYSLISQDFISTINDVTLSGGSVVLLGPRYVGKRYVIHHLRLLWEAQAVSPFVTLQFMSETPVCTTQQLADAVGQAVAKVAPDIDVTTRPHDDPLEAVKRLARREQRPVYLTAANVDGMAHHLARSFLQSVRTLVTAGPGEPKVIAVMSGEDDFHELVYGPNSEFNCAKEQYVLQGYTEAEFDGCLRRYLSNMHLPFADLEEASAHLFRLSGGNTYLLRIILWSILQTRTRHGVARQVTIKDIPDSFKIMNVPGAYGSHIFRRATQIIEREPECWRDLEELLKPEPEAVPVPPEQNTPGQLELAGVAVRAKDPDTGREHLKVSSTLMRAFLKQYYNARRLGDLYARTGDWERAFERYRRPKDDEERKRPSGADDREDVETTINALTAALFRRPKKTTDDHTQLTESVKRLFIGGCNNVLGFRQVTFWNRVWQADPEWKLDPKVHQPPPRVHRRILRLLPEVVARGELPLPEGENKFAKAAILRALRPDEEVAVVVSDFEPDVVISRERERLLQTLFGNFIEAYTHAVELDDLNTRLRARDEHGRIMNSIFRSLGESNLSVDKVLTLAAEGLLRLQYRRVIFSLVDPERRYIEVVLDRGAPLGESTAGLFQWPLIPSTAHIHPFVVSTRKPQIISDIKGYRDEEFMDAARVKALAIIPILINQTQKALGTVLVERENGELPSEPEVDDLRAFCSQLAIAIEQCERVNMLESGINRIPEPLIIVDGTASPRYANQPAAELLGGDAGWRDRNQSEPLSREKDGDIADIVRESMKRGFRLAGRVEKVGMKPDYRGEVVADAIRDSRDKKVVGGLIRIQDRNYLHKYFAAAQMVAESSDRLSAMRNMLRAAEDLGHKWGRLYLARADGEGHPTVFVSAMSFGYKDPERAEKFAEGRITLDLSAPHSSNEDLCIRERRPVAFCWLDNVKDGEEYVTPHGLRAINWIADRQPEDVRKTPGTFWIDFPLATPNSVTGKMCLQCDKAMRPEDFELLKQLAESFEGLLEAFRQRELNFGEREETIRVAVAQKILATMAHNLGTRMAGLPLLRSRYKALEKRLPEMGKTNDRLTHTIERLLTTIKRAQETLAPEIRQLSRVDIAAELERTLSSRLPRASWSLECTQGPVEMDVDTYLIDTALLELVQNSRDHAHSNASLKITLTVEPSPQDESVSVTYRDNGPGVPDELVERIFEDFFSRRPGRKTGTGLGLGFVRRVVEAHGGKISYNKLMRPGAAFVITLPRLGGTRQTQEDHHVSYSGS